ncbi:MAG TPA: mannose-1-phosphate guanyltransferase [Planctomycetes bacterium]|nr:mannose-1-phosphate guanyltransferase [Planctomycetota bacterium]
MPYKAAMPTTYAVIMAGGSGTRFWPVSRSASPKQLTRIIGETTMIQATVARLQPLIPAERVLIITTAQLAVETRRQLPMLKPEQVIAEPVGRDTAACVALAGLIVERLSPGATMIMLPADQIIQPADSFQAALAAGVAVAQHGRLVTYGIVPRFPATGYGYLQLGEAHPAEGGIRVSRVARFVEKPDLERATQYLAAGNFRWNSGIFTWRTDVVLRELGVHCGWLTEALKPVAAAYGTPRFDAVLAEVYLPLKKVSIDYALMEHAKDVAAVEGDFAWDDVGSWDALPAHLPADASGTISRGETVAVGCSDCLLVSEPGAPLVAAANCHGLTIVATKDAVLVVPRGEGQAVKGIVDELGKRGRKELL